MEYFINYSDYNIQDFVADTSFREWVLNPSPQLDDFWHDFTLKNPAKAQILESARKLLVLINFEEELPAEYLVEESLEKALSTISKIENAPTVFSIFRRWAVAAVLLIVLSGTIYLAISPGKKEVQSAKTQPSPMDIAQGSQGDIAPGSNKAVLILADGSKVELDSANAGKVITQGNVQVIQMDGQLSYEGNGAAKEVQYNTITTPRGGQYMVILADGSKVWLNAESSLRFPTVFAGEERKVEMEGEAYFEVAKNQKMPFYVKSGEMEVQVLGTHFNINAYNDEKATKTTLLEGSVKVNMGSAYKIIKPGEQAVIPSLAGGRVDASKIRVQNCDIEEAVGWKNGLFHFNKADLPDVMRQLCRWYNVEVEYEGEIPKREFEGEIQRNLKLSQVLELLGKNRVNFKISGHKIKVMP